MRSLSLVAAGALLLAACTAAPVYQTYASAFGDYDSVFDTTVSVLDKYSLLRVVDRDTGLVIGEMQPDNRFVDPTRREIVARIHKRENYSDVEVRVVYSVEDAQLTVHGGVPSYTWRRLDMDSHLQQELTNEIKETLSGNAWEGKRDPSVPAAAAARPDEALEEVSPANRAVIDQIQQQQVTLSFEDVALVEVFDYLREIAGLNIVLARSARQAFEEGEAAVTLQVKDVALEEALELLSLASPVPFGLQIRHGVLLVTSEN